MNKLFLVGLVFIAGWTNAADYKTQLSGKNLIMSGANCAGISLKNNSGLSSERGNPECSVNLPARVKWLDESTFMLVEKNKPNETNPPRVYIYKVKSISGKKVVLSEIWTGWGNQPDSITTYTIK
ncbi:hypothetical protein [Acinetobacter nosocomialis]|uniref:hypothetical protein n=1 Tax=Acinetobacter nosocomialis TaxID=106654 RepID=UPI00237E450B|nr:hypothetical protein [Acinetobacter nosocomialis]MDE1703229.1 hypothetical protein [Acinetobacter nosocomialis]HDG7211738.1 hypothetical protein [Acinetobacter nosocomialis]